MNFKLNKNIDFLIEQIDNSLFNEEGTLEYIMQEAWKEVDNPKNGLVDYYEWKAYTMNIINQCKNFLKSFKEAKSDE